MALPPMLPLYRSPEIIQDNHCNITNHWTGKKTNLYLLGKDEGRGDVWGCVACLRVLQAVNPSEFAAIQARGIVRQIEEFVVPE